MSFKMDTGEMIGSKAVYKNASFSKLRGGADPDGLADVARSAEDVLPWPVEQVILRRSEILVY